MLRLTFELATLAVALVCCSTARSFDDPATAPSSAEVWVLRYRYQPEQMLRYESHQETTINAQADDVQKTDRSELKQRRRYSVLATQESGAAQFAMQFEHVWMQMQSDNQPAVTFDSTMRRDEIPSVFRTTAHQLRGKAPRYWLSSCGLSLNPIKAQWVSDKQKVQASQDDIVTADSSNATSSGDDVIQLVEGVELSKPEPNAQAETVDPGSFLAPLPEFAVHIGDTWTEKSIVKVRLTQDISREIPILQTFRLERVENGIAAISFRSSIEAPSLTTMVRSQLIQATPRGSFTLDLARGIMTRREMTHDTSVPGAFGPESLLTCNGTCTETLLE